MKRILASLSVLALLCCTLTMPAAAHGGTYKGPGDVVPPGGGGPGPVTPGPTGPVTPGPSGPTTPGPSGPTTPGPSGPPTAGPAAKGPTTGGAMISGPDLTRWEFWWGFNQDPFLQLKAHIHSDRPVTGDANFWMGRGEKSDARDTLRPSKKQIEGEVIPALLRTLETEEAMDVVSSVLVALGKIGWEPKTVGPLIAEKLKASNQEISESAAVSLGILGDPVAIPLLTHLVMDDDDGAVACDRTRVPFRTRAFAAYGLGLIGRRIADVEEKANIRKVLLEVIETDKSPNRDTRIAAVIAWGLVGGEGVETDPVLMALLEDRKGDQWMRAQVPIVMARIGDSSKLPVLHELLESKKTNQYVKQSCAIALGQLTDENTDPKLRAEIVGSLQHEFEKGRNEVKNFAAIALGRIGGQDCQDYLLRQVTRGRDMFKPWAALSLGILGYELADAGQTPPRIMAEKIREQLEEMKNPSFLGCFGVSLGLLKDQGAKDLIKKQLLSLNDDDARGYLSLSLGLMDARGTLDTIQKLVKDSKRRPELLQQAAIGLGLLGDKTVVPVLLDMLDEASSVAVQAACAGALGFIGDSRSITPLVAMMEDTEKVDLARGFAAVALGIVSDKDDLPWNTPIKVGMNYLSSVGTLTGEGAGILDIL